MRGARGHDLGTLTEVTWRGKQLQREKLHLILRPWEWIFTFCWFSWARGRCCADLFCVFLSVYKRGPFIFLWKKKSFQAKHVWFMLPRTWICLDLGFNKTNCKACRKAARFCAYRTFFFCFCSLENSLWPQLLRWTLYLHLCLTSALQQIFIHLALLQPPQFFLHSSSHPLLLVSYWPFVLPLSSSSSSSPISLFFSSPSLSLSLQSPTSSWTPLLVSCSWLIIPHGNIFSVDVRELLLLLMKILNIAAPAQPHQKKKMWMVGGEKAGNQLFLLSSKYCHVWWRFYKLLRCIFSIC